MCDGYVKVSFGGDIMCLKTETDAVVRKFGRLDYDGYIGDLKPLFENSDYVVANLETPISSSCPLTTAAMRFNTDEALLLSLRNSGFNFLATANNHCLDAGVQGLEETIDALDRKGFDHDGTYTSEAASEMVFVRQIGGMRIAFLSFTYGTNSEHNGVMLPEGEAWRVALLKKQNKLRKLPVSQDLANGNFRTYIADDVQPAAIGNPINESFLRHAIDKVRNAKALSDFVVVMPHVGGQFNPGPATYAKYIVRRFREAGADLIVAGHPHVLQRCDVGGDGKCFAAYSLGNLCFTPGVGFFVPNVLSEYGAVLHIYIDRRAKKLCKTTFDVVKSVVDEDGSAHSMPVVDLLANETNAAKRDRLLMENEVVVNRFRGTCVDIVPQREYCFGE